MNLKDSVQLEFGSVIGLLKREMESGPITNLYLNLIRSKQLARECKQTACEPSLSSIFALQEYEPRLHGTVHYFSYYALVKTNQD